MDEVVVIGGGPAGLSAALVLARGCLPVRLVDAGPRRNASASAMHGIVGHDGVAPDDFQTSARAQLARYGVVSDARRAVSLERRGSSLLVGLEGGAPLPASRVLVATGLVDLLPKLPGMKDAWGKSAFSCPHCHGYEHKGQRWGLLALQKSMASMAPLYLRWTPSLTLLLNGRTDLSPETLAMLERRSIAVEPRALTGLRVEEGSLKAATFGDGELALDAILLHPHQRQTDLVLFAGLTLDAEGYVKVDEQHQTSMAGVYAAGDLTGGSARAITAASMGADAAVAIIESTTR